MRSHYLCFLYPMLFFSLYLFFCMRSKASEGRRVSFCMRSFCPKRRKRQKLRILLFYFRSLLRLGYRLRIESAFSSWSFFNKQQTREGTLFSHTKEKITTVFYAFCDGPSQYPFFSFFKRYEEAFFSIKIFDFKSLGYQTRDTIKDTCSYLLSFIFCF